MVMLLQARTAALQFMSIAVAPWCGTGGGSV